eukprot:8420146-Lingulodinium_polyedra.AAC.1
MAACISHPLAQLAFRSGHEIRTDGWFPFSPSQRHVIHTRARACGRDELGGATLRGRQDEDEEREVEEAAWVARRRGAAG